MLYWDLLLVRPPIPEDYPFHLEVQALHLHWLACSIGSVDYQHNVFTFPQQFQVGSINFSKYLKAIEDEDIDKLISVKQYDIDLVSVTMPENILAASIELSTEVYNYTIKQYCCQTIIRQNRHYI